MDKQSSLLVTSLLYFVHCGRADYISAFHLFRDHAGNGAFKSIKVINVQRYGAIN